MAKREKLEREAKREKDYKRVKDIGKHMQEQQKKR